jgi:hypothetical protein
MSCPCSERGMKHAQEACRYSSKVAPCVEALLCGNQDLLIAAREANTDLRCTTNENGATECVTSAEPTRVVVIQPDR